MISRRKIISRSLDNLDTIVPTAEEEEEDVWIDQEKLFQDHINEIISKWQQIDDEIWAKIVIFEKNRRVAKAYARSSVISINDSKHGFDGVRIGLNGFENPMRDSETKVIKKSIGDGFKIKMDEVGNIFIKRYGKSGVFVHTTGLSNEETVIGSDIQQNLKMALNLNTSSKLFDMRKFTANINYEFSRTYPEFSRLERQCFSAITLVKSNDKLLNSPLWILVINMVAIDMLRNRLQILPKLNPAELNATSAVVGTGSGGGMILRRHGSTNLLGEDPYSTIESQVGLIYPTPEASDESNTSNPPVITTTKAKTRRSSLQRQNVITENSYTPKRTDCAIYTQTLSMFPQKKNKQPMASGLQSSRKKQDDPYYCGLLARIPNFIKTSSGKGQHCQQKCLANKKEAKIARKISNSQQHLLHHGMHSVITPPHPMPIATFHQQLPIHNYYPYKLFTQPHYNRLSKSQLSLWDARSLISAHE